MDFRISDNGELLFDESTNNQKLKISFHSHNNNGMRIVFKTPEYDNDSIDESALKISFSTNIYNTTYTSEVSDNIEYEQQRLIIALRTEYGEIINHPQLGSRLKLIKHKMINSNSLLKEIEKETQKAINYIIPNAKIIAKQEYIDNYYGSNNISIYIYKNNFLIFKFYI